VADVANASVVLLIVMFIFVLLGMQLFGGVYDQAFTPDEKPRAHFDTFWWAFVTVFQVLTGENWNEVLYNTMFAAGAGQAVIYFVALQLFGTYLILNLFLAILLGNFEGTSEDEDGEEDESDLDSIPGIQNLSTNADFAPSESLIDMEGGSEGAHSKSLPGGGTSGTLSRNSKPQSSASGREDAPKTFFGGPTSHGGKPRIA